MAARTLDKTDWVVIARGVVVARFRWGDEAMDFAQSHYPGRFTLRRESEVVEDRKREDSQP